MKLHLGCGARNFGPDWIHIDGGTFDHVEHHDIVNLPFDDNSVDLIYACHVFEYFDRIEGAEVLSKWYNKLRVGGILRLAVPDFGAMAILYAEGRCQLSDIIGPMYGRMKMDDVTIYHRTTYDKNALTRSLQMAGFHDVRLYDWRKTEHAHIDDHSRSYLPKDEEAIKAMKYDSKHRLISLNMEATK